MLNEADLLILEKHRLDRFRHAFGGAMLQAALWITFDHDLVIPCLSEEQAVSLQQEAEALRHFGWLILGVDRVSLYLEQQLVWETHTRELQVVLVDSPLVLKTNDSQGEAMGTATLERTIEARQLEELPAQPLRTVDELAAELANITGRTVEEMRLEILNLNPATYQFREYQLISPAVADQTIDRWSQQLKARLRSVKPPVETQSNGAAPSTPTPAAPTAKAARKPAAKKATKAATKKPATRKSAANPTAE